MQQAHGLSAVAAVTIHDRDSVPADTDIFLYQGIWFLRRDLQRYPLKAMVKVIDGFGRDKLK